MTPGLCFLAPADVRGVDVPWQMLEARLPSPPAVGASGMGTHRHMAKMSRQPHREPCGSRARPQQVTQACSDSNPNPLHHPIQPWLGQGAGGGSSHSFGCCWGFPARVTHCCFSVFYITPGFCLDFYALPEGYPAQTCLLTFQPCCSKDPAPVPRALRGPGAVSWPHSHTVLTPSLSSSPAISGTDTGAGVSMFHSSARPCAAHRGSSHPHVRQ